MEATGLGYLAAGLGAALTVIGAGLGIGKLAAAAMEASGRQPEVAGQVRTSMIIAAALIEGATFFALAICIILAAPVVRSASPMRSRMRPTRSRVVWTWTHSARVHSSPSRASVVSRSCAACCRSVVWVSGGTSWRKRLVAFA